MNKQLRLISYLVALFLSFVAILVAVNDYFPYVRKIYFSFAYNNHQGRDYILNHIPVLYNNYSYLIKIHIFFGLLMILIWPLQFSSFLRIKYRKIHYLLGTLFFVSAFTVGCSALIISFQVPFGGVGEGIVNLLVVFTFFYCLFKSLVKIKEKNFREHKKWIIRSLSLALGIITQRFLFVHDVFFFSELPAKDLFVLSAFLGFFGNLLIAEVTIKKLRI